MNNDTSLSRSCRPVSPPALDENTACDKCGAFGAYAWDGIKLCLACYTAQGSCCAEAEEREKPSSANPAS